MAKRKRFMVDLKNIDTLLLDLDGTLLHFDLNDFIQGYLEMIRDEFADYSWSDQVAQWILTGTDLMLKNSGTQTNRQVFLEYFSKMSGLNDQEIWHHFMEFYEQKFDRLQTISDRNYSAIRFIEKSVTKGYNLVLATQPVFPEIAIRKRLQWAGLAHIPFILITDIEKMNAAKPSLVYFEQVLQLIQTDAGRCIMIGNDPVADMAAEKAGIPTFFLITEKDQAIPQEAHYSGQFSDLEKLLGLS